MYIITSTEDQQKFVVPMNRDTECLFYNQRIIIDAPVLTEPRTWEITKVNRVGTLGICNITLAQTSFNEHTDYIELDDDGQVIGQWADYWKSNITPTDPESEETLPTIYSSITYSGVKPEIKLGGGYKKLTCTFYNSDNEPIDFRTGTWSFSIKDMTGDISDVLTILYPDASTDLEENRVKIKFAYDNTYLNHILVCKYTSDDGIESSVELEILAL